MANAKFLAIHDDFAVVGVNDTGWCFDITASRSKEKIAGREISGGEDVKIPFSSIFVDERQLHTIMRWEIRTLSS